MKKLLAISLFTFTISLFNNVCKAQTFAQYTFDSLSSGMTSPGAYVLALAMKDSTLSSPLYAGGHFKIAGRDTSLNVAEWINNGIPNNTLQGKWVPLGKGVDSDVCALATFNKYLYAGGKFDTAAGIAASHIARWDTGTHTWDSLLGKLNGNVYALCVYNKALYVGGDFTIADGDTVNRIAVWRDSVWAAVGKGFDTGAVYALAVSDDTLYAGGSFLKSNGVAVNHIAKLSGNRWDSVRGGTNNTVYALSDYNGGTALVAGGAFTKSGNTATRYISYFAQFAQLWEAYGVGVNDTVRALNAGFGEYGEVVKKTGQGIGGGNIMFVGGNFDSAGGYHSHYVAGIFNGTWDSIGELNGPVFALANPYQSFSSENYVGGKFDFARNAFNGSDTANNVAYLWVFLGGGIQSLSDNYNVNVYPNPSRGNYEFQIMNYESGKLNVEVYNVLGEKIYHSQTVIRNSQFVIDLNQPNGIYLYRIIANNGSMVGEGKLVIQK